MNPAESPPGSLDPGPDPGRGFLGFGLTFYGVFIVLSGAVLFHRHGIGLLDAPDRETGIWMGLAAIVAGITIAVTRLGPRWVPALKALEDEFRRILGGFSRRDAFLLAAFSSVGEELLFRGVLQPRLGLVLTTILFGLVHAPVSRILLPWTVFAFLMGLLLGGLYEVSGSLWPPILLHFLVNDQNLTYLGRRRESVDELEAR